MLRLCWFCPSHSANSQQPTASSQSLLQGGFVRYLKRCRGHLAVDREDTSSEKWWMVHLKG